MLLAKSTGTKLISACGNINKPGVYEIDMKTMAFLYKIVVSLRRRKIMQQICNQDNICSSKELDTL